MSNFKLNLPTDIPWKRICVTEDMIDRDPCDMTFPPKWQTSLAVFQFAPEEEDQLFPDYRITYLKVTATITGYQPIDDEIQGEIDWDGVDITTMPGLKDLLTSYNPCHGAILQVLVGPSERRGRALPLDEYPFFMDFEPKKRELYEMATDTQEKQSRSIESLNITKSAGSTQSMEVLDIDQGGGGFGAQASYAGTGGGFTYQAPHGQWGTKRLNADESLASRSSDVAQEKRETYSYSTQLSQMYHLLDSYHLGTNRAVFFVQPRPHTLEEPSGFVRGPRPVEGIQEFFLIVAQPKDQDDFCVGLRLDTSHITKTPIMDFERKSIPSDIATANAPVASKADIPDGTIVGARACFIDCWDVYYKCFRTEANDTVTVPAPAGYRIEGYNNLIQEASHGSTSVSITPNGQTLTINAQARGHICYEDSGVCIDCPDTIQAYAGHARRQVQVNLISLSPTVKVGEEEVLMITTRGLCCCASDEDERLPLREPVLAFRPIPERLLPARARHTYATARPEISETRAAREASEGRVSTGGQEPYAGATSSRVLALSSDVPSSSEHSHEDGPCIECLEKMRGGPAGTSASAGQSPGAYTIRQVNELSDFVRTETLRTVTDPTVEPKRFVETDYFAKQLEYQVAQTPRGRTLLDKPAREVLPQGAVAKLARHLGLEPDEVKVRDAWLLRGTELATVTGLKPDVLRRTRLKSLGVTFKEDDERAKPRGRKRAARSRRKLPPSAS